MNPSPSPNSDPPPSAARSLFLRLLDWRIWAGLVVVSSLGVAGYGISQLFSMPEFPECEALLPEDSTSARLYCAQSLADKQTIADLRQAIGIANQISSDDPLRLQGDRQIERWSQDLLRLGEVAFQSGNLDQARTAAQSIPVSSSVYETGRDRLRQWEATWEKGEELYKEAKSNIEQQEWSEATQLARGLFALGNRHWETTKYQELMEELQAARDDQKDNKSRNAKLPAKLGSDLFSHRSKIQEREGIAHLQKASALAKAGDLPGLRSAVAEAEQVFIGSSRYDEAQRWVKTWQQQIETLEDQPILSRANQLAKKGDEASLQAAIAEASQVAFGRALYNEARERIEQWNDRVFQLQEQAYRQFQPLPLEPLSSSSPVRPVVTDPAVLGDGTRRDRRSTP